MIPMTLVTGFLGSGKTTLLTRIIERNRHRRLAYLVNEYSTADIDGRRLRHLGADVFSIVGGSIFCRCKVTRFVDVLRTLADETGNGGRLEGVVVEASGMADPRVAARMLEETRLNEHYRPGSVVSVVDPGTFPALRQTFPLLIAQIEASTLAILNKMDLYDESCLCEIEQAVRQINPAARLVRAAHGQVEVDVLAAGVIPALDGRYAREVDRQAVSLVLEFNRPVDREAFLSDVRAMLPDIYRLKGHVPARNGILCVEVTPGGAVQVAEAGERSWPTTAALIVAPRAARRAGELMARWTGSLPCA